MLCLATHNFKWAEVIYTCAIRIKIDVNLTNLTSVLFHFFWIKSQIKKVKRI